MKHRTKIIGLGLVFAAFGSAALTLGRVGGAALIGQPLDVPIQVQMDAAEDASSLCLEADVFHADTRQDAGRVRVLIQAGQQTGVATVRVTSQSIVDEPVVTIYLRSGCGQKVTRRYVLLADIPSEIAPPSVLPMAPVTSEFQAIAQSPPVAPVSAVTPSRETAVAPQVGPAATKARTAGSPKPRVGRLVASKPKDASQAVVRSRSTPSAKVKAPGPSAGQPRLQLDPLELLSKRVATLEASTPATPPEDGLRELQRTQSLERDVKALLALAARNEASLVDLKARLHQAEAQRFPAILVYGLSVLVVVCLAAVALLWTRQRRPQQEGEHWSHGSPATPSPEPTPPGSGLAFESPSMKPDASDTWVVSQVEMSESDFARLDASAKASRENDKQYPATQPAEMVQTGKHNFASDAVFDIRQQAEFFVSLGQTDKAMQILQKQINESDEPNPFVYLDLLSIFHSLNLKTDFRQFREDLVQMFNVRVPEFALFMNEGKGLELYSEILSHIIALWPSPKSLEIIETCIFREPWDSKGEVFDLAAFRDLLLLHAVGQTIARDSAQEPDRPGRASSSSVAPRDRAATHFSDAGYAHAMVPGEIDLDLSNSDLQGSGVAAPAVVDLDIPLAEPDDSQSGGR